MLPFISKKRHFWGWAFGGILLVALSGCAPAYHAYRDGCVPYGYGPPPALPYTAYQQCPTPIAKQYLSGPHEAPPSAQLPSRPVARQRR